MDVQRVFIKSLGDGPRLSRDEEIVLIAKAQRGDMDARNAVVENHIPFVLSRAALISRSRPGIDAMDLTQIGAMSLMRCLEKGRYDPKWGVRFLSYAGSSCCRDMMRHVNTRRTSITIPDYTHPSAREHLRPETVERWKSFVCSYVEDLTGPEGNVIPVDEMKGQSVDRPFHIDELPPMDKIYECMDKLAPRESKVIRMRYNGSTLKEVGESMGGFTSEGIRQIQFRAEAKLRKMLREAGGYEDEWQTRQ
jgi:RNA polymerase sigma factor (sigma-70 family)